LFAQDPLFAQDSQNKNSIHVFLPFMSNHATLYPYQVHFLAPGAEKLSSDVRMAVTAAVNSSSYIKPEDDTNVFMVSLQVATNWALATMTTANLLDQHPISAAHEASIHEESKLTLNNLFEVLIVKVDSVWLAASQYDDGAQKLLEAVPLTEFNQRARTVIFPKDVSVLLDIYASSNRAIQQQYDGYKLPWISNVAWRRTNGYGDPGWHDGAYFSFEADHGLDFDIVNATNGDILAAASGTIFNTCDGANGNWLWVIQTDGTSERLGYLHIDKSTRPNLAEGQHVNQGDYLGRMLPSSSANPIQDTCGKSVGTHLHMYFPMKPFTIDGYTFRADYTYQNVDLYSSQGNAPPPLAPQTRPFLSAKSSFTTRRTLAGR